ncbi:hypothetical protein TBLA_0H03240 [Henningerozyma blattae CBS 6284]|uniref:RNA helicase n=1 Tax=Henningerozyma blattae (strain ATCC 34711 / CBS 6284 / DSM 70876 / NBRC 10599 / NRRL Y-10934 / UCD 77-7) TaxID=1071380 RepID=I2H8A3_HENB6|nr:hypothetical protein TBLA_0H03240 [Tetrapisispora blattae CBS 6284]CCH62605.1 hypothetical protein TBLA_0H03240 [Tetrapisispora blattae CBS 6284]
MLSQYFKVSRVSMALKPSSLVHVRSTQPCALPSGIITLARSYHNNEGANNANYGNSYQREGNTNRRGHWKKNNQDNYNRIKFDSNNYDRNSVNRDNFNRDNYSRNNYSRNNYDGKNYGNNNYGKKKIMSPDSNDSSITFNKKKFSKLVVVPKDENTAEITLDQLLEDKVIDKKLFTAVHRLGFKSLTPVQQKTIKPILKDSGNDVIARAKTGTGKTFAFLLPLFQKLIESPNSAMVKSVIMAPTRDLALQIEQEILKLYKNNSALRQYNCLSIVGGTNYSYSLQRLHRERPNIIVATPGRMLAVLSDFGDKFFSEVDFKVLDEADRLLEIGFKEDLVAISNSLDSVNSNGADHIRTLLFSATLDDKVQTLANDIMNKEECLFLDTIDKNEPEAHENINQNLVVSDAFSHSIYAVIEHIRSRLHPTELPIAEVTTEEETKVEAGVESVEETEVITKATKPFDKHDTQNYKAILFTPTVKCTKFLSQLIKREFQIEGIPIYEFHGKIDQNRRTRIVEKFKRANSGILVCTDVGARGMDFPNVQEVLQLGVPSELSNYVHRIGRTARAGKKGISTAFLSKDELPFVRCLEKSKKIYIENQVDYVPNESIISAVESKLISPEDLSNVFVSLLSFYKSVVGEYGLKELRVLTEIAKSFGSLFKDPKMKIQISSGSQLSRLGFTRIENYFDTSGNHERSFYGTSLDEDFLGGNYDDNGHNNRFNSRGFSNDNNRYRDNNHNYRRNTSFNKNNKSRYSNNMQKRRQGSSPRIED